MTRRAWAGVITLLVTASLACVVLGYWQWTRHVQRSELVAVVQANLDAPAVPATELLGENLQDPVTPDDVWRKVGLAGEWIPDTGIQLRNRPVDGANASRALALLRTTEGAVLTVDRGWFRQEAQPPPGALDLPPGPVDLVVRLRAAEPPDSRTPPPGQAYSVTPDALLASLVTDGALTPAIADAIAPDLASGTYAMVLEPAPAPPLESLPSPSTSLGSHLSYAFQWWFFALAIPASGVVLMRREQQKHDDETQSQPARQPRQSRRRPTLAQEEDALLDAQEAPQASETSSA